MTDVRVAHTADLDTATLAAIRNLLFAAFEQFTEHDWEHALGGMHGVLRDGGAVLGHASVVQRRLVHNGKALRAGYFEGVAVHPDHQRLGHGSRLMAALERVLRDGYEIGALSAAERAARLYTSLGWQQWKGPLWALTPNGTRRTAEEDGGVYVLELGVPLDVAGDLICDWRDGDLW